MTRRIIRYLEDMIHFRARGILPLILRIPLIPLSFIYAGAVSLRNLLYYLRIFKIHKLNVPVISVGNITVGGTGKTPTALMLIDHFIKKGRKVALLARGYGKKHSLLNDELNMVRNKFPDIIIHSGADRVMNGLKAIEQGAELIILDDGFQHRRIHRDCNIVLVDSRIADKPKLLLPAGPYREPWHSMKRADIVLFTKSESHTPSKPFSGALALKDKPYFLCTHKPSGLVRGDFEKPLDFLKGKNVYLFTGIADPWYFKDLVTQLGAEISGYMFYPDHHDYSLSDIDTIRTACRDKGASIALTTEKDIVKIEELLKNEKNNIEFLALSITIEIFPGTKVFLDTVNELSQR